MSNVTAVLGTPVEVTIEMPLAAVEETINVVATADEIINPNRTGSTSAVSDEPIENAADGQPQHPGLRPHQPVLPVDADRRSPQRA